MLYEWIGKEKELTLSFSIKNPLLRPLWQLVQKKYPGPEVDIIFGNSFDTNSKIQLYNKKGKQNSKIAFAFENSIETKIKIRDFFSIKKTKIK